MAAPGEAPPLMSILFPRSQVGDFVNVGAIDADVVQLAVRIGRKLLQHAPKDTTCAQEARKREHLHGGLLLLTTLPISASRLVGSLLLLELWFDSRARLP
jgi:hypothetical protein